MDAFQGYAEVYITSLYKEVWIYPGSALLRVRLEVSQEQLSALRLLLAFIQLLEEFPALRRFKLHGDLRHNLLLLDLDAIVVAEASIKRIEAFFMLVTERLKQLLSPQPPAWSWKRTRD